MNCSINECNRKIYKTTKYCSFHRNYHLYGMCKWTHKNNVVANGLDGLCQRCRLRGEPQVIYINKMCLKCKKRKTSSRGLCNFCVRKENYGLCKNGCKMPANDKYGECSNCKIRGGPTKIMGRIINSDTHRWCPRCESILTINNFYLQKHSGKKVAKYCKKCNQYNALIRKRAINFGQKNIVQTSAMLCVKCWEPLSYWEVDHILPQSLGGSNDIDNLQIMCRDCNRKKGNRETIDYRVFILEGS